MARLIAISAAATVAWSMVAAGAIAAPFRGSIAWSVLLCKYTDSGDPPQSPDHFSDMVVRRGTGGLADYWHSMSLGGVNLNGSVVKGWYTIPMTAEQARKRSRQEKVDDCIAAAAKAPRDAYRLPKGGRVAVITFPEIDLFGGAGRVMVPHSADLGALQHEMGHGLGLGHSFSDDLKYQNAVWSAPGEYDDQWDIMSWAHVHTFKTKRFGRSGPGLNAYFRDVLGWLPRSRIVTFGADGATSRTITIAPLGQAQTAGPYLVRVPFDAADPFHYYTIEYRRKEAWDAGIPSDLVLLHEISRRPKLGYRPTLLREPSKRQPVQQLNANGVAISVVSVQGDSATVKIESKFARQPKNPAASVYGPNTCRPGLVWREADDSDWVCVSPQSRARIRDENARAARGKCGAGQVWRDAFPGDQVCVSPAVRTQVAKENLDAATQLLTR